MDEKVLEVKDLRKTYIYKKSLWSREKIHVEALDEISFDVSRNEIFGLLGPNGAGKTTALNIISGLIYPDAGSVRVFGMDVKKQRQQILERMNIAAAFTAMYSRLTIIQNLKVYAKLYNIKKAADKIERLLEFFDLNDIMNKQILSLSTGQKVRVNLCKALINDPELLLLDEVTLGLDPEIAQDTREMIKKLPESVGSTILLASNNMSDIERLCDRIAFIHQGKILRIGTPNKLKKLVGKRSLEDTFIKIMSELRNNEVRK